MATVINNPGEREESSVNVIVGALLAVVILFLFFFYGLPAIRDRTAAPNDDINVNVDLPNNVVPDGSSGEESGTGETYTP